MESGLLEKERGFINMKRIKESQLLGKTTSSDYDTLQAFMTKMMSDEGFSIDADDISSIYVYFKDPVVTLSLDTEAIEFRSVDTKFQSPFRVTLRDLKTLSFSIGMKGMIKVNVLTKGGSTFGGFMY